MLQTPTTNEAGGFAAGTHIITTNGPKPIEDLTRGDELLTLGPETHRLHLTSLRAVESRRYEGPLVRVETRRAALHLHPEHPIPYVTKTIRKPRFQAVGDLSEREEYKFLNEWRSPSTESRTKIDVTAFLEDYEVRLETDVHGHTVRAALPEGCEPCYTNSHTGYHFDTATFEEHREAITALADDIGIVGGRNQRARPFRFATDDFLCFLGWFVTEGSTTWKQDRNSGTVQIAQQKPVHRRAIRELLTRMGFDFQDRPQSFRIGSILYTRLMESLCGASSGTMRLPEFVWSLDTNHLETLHQTLMRGDGNERGTYYTASEFLFRDFTRLVIRLGMKPRYTKRRGAYHIFCNDVNDGFRTSEHVTHTPYSGAVYRLIVEDASAVMAGRNGKFQWCGTIAVNELDISAGPS